jgi:hypothetical protein
MGHQILIDTGLVRRPYGLHGGSLANLADNGLRDGGLDIGHDLTSRSEWVIGKHQGENNPDGT